MRKLKAIVPQLLVEYDSKRVNKLSADLQVVEEKIRNRRSRRLPPTAAQKATRDDIRARLQKYKTRIEINKHVQPVVNKAK